MRKYTARQPSKCMRISVKIKLKIWWGILGWSTIPLALWWKILSRLFLISLHYHKLITPKPISSPKLKIKKKWIMYLLNKKRKCRQKLVRYVNPWKYRRRKQRSKTKTKVRTNLKLMNRLKKITTTMSSLRESLELSDTKNSHCAQSNHRANKEVTAKSTPICWKIKKKAKKLKMKINPKRTQ